MKKRIILLALFIVAGEGISAQNIKAPKAKTTVSSSVAVNPAVQAFFQKAPTTLWTDNADESWYNATTTEFTLTTPAQVAGLAKIVNAGNDFTGKIVIFGNDMDFGAHLWMPIGKGYLFPFSGTVKGNNKTVSNIQIDLPAGDFVGFVGQMFKGKIENLIADQVTVSGHDTVGSIVGNLSTNSTMTNCHAKNVNISGTDFNVGGLVGGILTDSSISDSSAEGDVSGSSQVGGLVGTAWDKTSIARSYAKGTVTGQYIVGGFAGYSTMAFGPNRNNEVTDSYTRSNVVAMSERVGGFYGGPESNAVVTNVYSTGTVSNVSASGGFAGFVANMSAANIYYDHTNAPIDAIGMFLAAPATYDIKAWTTKEMKTQNLATSLNAGRATAVWFYDAAKNDGYPTLAFEQALATSDYTSNTKIQVYPTVVTDFLTINSKEKNISYQVVDFSGRMLKSGTATDSKINLSSLANGNYMLVVQIGGQVSSHKFFKK
ncbi:GLUG motif-containing protein [Kaistella palustris]|uniref:GLUG motif-containing protein n=1 Tax=Kaistella palustris TaxID=493376 RepID=UPI000429C0AC|nr:GLUG motif-containing protein [Kaistella palustris]